MNSDTYVYKDHEIYARVWSSISHAYDINSKGEIKDVAEWSDAIDNQDQEIVWYEVEAIDVDQKPFPITTWFTELKTLEEAKAIVDKSTKYLEELDNE
jgi:hypothetical protein